MQAKRNSIILGTAFLATVALSPAGAQASPSSHTRSIVTAGLADPTPYQKGYDSGSSNGYARGLERARAYCARDPWLPWPEVGADAYKLGYSEGFQLAYGRGFDDGAAKYCRPA
ncbi:hypothetical protein [Nonomuraea sp. NPDC050786]|uniref:hypothetical protein n=1 Tax=Nonomuraea sp. NPDC050786 TaxID=3154840 RepID=UPI0033C13B2D